MNHCYRLVFNKSSQIWQVVSEIAKSHSKSAALVLLPLLSLLPNMAAWADPALNALPTGGQVVSGQSVITQNGNQLNILQSTQKTIINWNTYNIGANAQVAYVQPNANAISLNRVTSGNPSEIFGKLNSNGQVWLINPNGVLFGKSAQVNVGGIVATTLNIADEDFLNGKYQFTGNAGSVINMGSIVANSGGYVAMLAPEVRNEGVISALQGTVAMSAGNAITLDFNGNGLINVQVDSASVNTLVENKHLIQVGNGQVLMSTKAADGLITSVINNSGKIEANSMVSDGGVIRLTGAKTVVNSGEISAVSSSQKGGTVHLLGDNVGMFSTSSVNVSGKTGGGTILVGGDYQGKNADIQNATKTFVHQDAQLIADATDSGDGGKVIVWANDITRYYGSVSAKGGAVSGNGGFVEISGKKYLDYIGKIDVTAYQGIGGKVFFDPLNIVLNSTTQTAPSDNANGTPDIAFADATGTTTFIEISDITGYSEAFFQATNDIAVDSAITMADNNSIKLEAGNNLTVNSSVTTSGTGAVILKADADNNGTGNLMINAAIKTGIGGANLSGVNVTSTAVGTITTVGAVNTNSGNVKITATDSINLAGFIITAGVTAGVDSAGLNGGGVELLAGKSITVTGVSTSGSSGNGAGDLSGGNAGSISVIANSGINLTTTQSNGGSAVGNGNGGNAGEVLIRNADNTDPAVGHIMGSGNIIARAGASSGSGAGGDVATVNIENQANTGDVVLSGVGINGLQKGNGGNLNISSKAGVTVASINTNAGATVAENAGQHAGNITITGVNRTITGAIIANGGAGNGTDQAGGNAGVVSITGTGTLSTGTITAKTGNATGTGAGGVAGSVTLTGSSLATAAIDTSRGANGAGGNVNVTTTTVGGSSNIASINADNLGAININNADTLTVNGVIAGTDATVTKLGVGSLIYAGANTYTGATNVNAGTLALSADNRINDASVLTVAAGATFDLNGYAETVGSIAGAGNIVMGTAALTSGGNNASTTFSGVISGTAGNFNKAGSGTLTLSGNNTYTGVTNVQGGTLTAAHANALGATAGGTNVASGATLNVNNVTLAAEAITLANAAALTGTDAAIVTGNVSAGDNSQIGTTSAASTLTINGVLTSATNSTLEIIGAGSVIATNTDNDIDIVKITNAKDVSLRDMDSVRFSATASNLTGTLTVNAIDNIILQTGGTMTSSAGDILLTSNAFINNAGANALTATAGRWVVHTDALAGNIYGGLNSGNQAIYGRSLGVATAEAGNRYVFVQSPTLDITSTDQTKTYGQDAATLVANAYIATPFVNAATYGNVFTQDTIANSLTGSATSTGSAVASNVGSYAIDVTPVTATTGYTLNKSNAGNLTVTAAILPVSPVNTSGNISVFNNAVTRSDQELACPQFNGNQPIVNGLDAFGADNVDYEPSISQPLVGGVVANALAATTCLKL